MKASIRSFSINIENVCNPRGWAGSIWVFSFSTSVFFGRTFSADLFLVHISSSSSHYHPSRFIHAHSCCVFISSSFLRALPKLSGWKFSGNGAICYTQDFFTAFLTISQGFIKVETWRRLGKETCCCCQLWSFWGNIPTARRLRFSLAESPRKKKRYLKFHHEED